MGLLLGPALLAVIAASAAPASAQETPSGATCAEPTEEERYHIAAIELRGLVRTKPYVVHRELMFGEGEVVGCDRIEESIQRVRNTDLFRTVEYRLDRGEGQARDEEVASAALYIVIDEKWTALPQLQFTSGGGTYRLLLGAAESNLFGHFIGIGGQFERIGEANSFFGWIDNPRTLGKRLETRGAVGTQNRTFTLFDRGGEIEGGFLLSRFTVSATVRQEWRWWFRTEFVGRFDNEHFSTDFLPPEVSQRQGERGLPTPAAMMRGRLSALIGRIDQTDYRFDGTRLTFSVEHANSRLVSDHDLLRVGADLDYFATLPFKSNLAVRAQAFTADAEAIQHRFYLGGLDAIRGFPRDRFGGQHYWLANIEYRIPSIDIPWLAIQHVAFADAAGVGERFEEGVGLSGASAGLGVRILVPKIHNLVIRADYAFALSGEVTDPLNVGGAQFY